MRDLLGLKFVGWKAYGEFPEGPAPIGIIVNAVPDLTSLTIEVSDGRGHDHRWRFSALAWSHQVIQDGDKIEVVITRVAGAYDGSYGPESMMARVSKFTLAPAPTL